MHRISENCRTAGQHSADYFDNSEAQIQKKSNLDVSGCMMVVMMIMRVKRALI
jgi:hypothetical protein